MRQFLWLNVSHISAALVALGFWGVIRLTRATHGAYAKPRSVALGLGLAWFGLLAWAIYAYPGLGPFAAALIVTLFADNHYSAAYAAKLGAPVFHERATELLRLSGVSGFLRAHLPVQILQTALGLLLVGLSAGPADWFYWAALGLASAHALRALSIILFALKYRQVALLPVSS
jgi:hypothetical protein